MKNPFRKKNKVKIEAQVDNESLLQAAEMKREIDALEKLNDTLRRNLQKSHRREKHLVEKNKTDREKVSISRGAIRPMIQTMMQDDNVNLSWVPDSIEERMWENTFTLGLGLLENLLETTTIDVLNHRIRFVVEPIPEEELNKPKPSACTCESCDCCGKKGKKTDVRAEDAS